MGSSSSSGIVIMIIMGVHDHTLVRKDATPPLFSQKGDIIIIIITYVFPLLLLLLLLRDENQLKSVEKLQDLHQVVLDYHNNPDKYSTYTYKFVNFHVEKTVSVRLCWWW